MNEPEVGGQGAGKKPYRRPVLWRETLQVGGRRWKAVRLAVLEGEPLSLESLPLRFYAAPGNETFKRLAPGGPGRPAPKPKYS